MAKVKDYIDGVEIEKPLGIDETIIDLNFDSGDPQNVLGVDVPIIDLVGDEKTFVNDYISQAQGIFEGVPYQRRIDGQTIFDGYLDLTGENVEFCCDRINNIEVKRRQKEDWLETAGNISFEFLASPVSELGAGILNDNDKIFVPYVINTVPNYKEALIATIGIFTVSLELQRAIVDLQGFIAEVGNPFTSISTILKLVGYILYLASLILALIKLIKDLVTLLIQPVKYHCGMKLQTMLQKGASYFGMTFESSEFDNDNWKDCIIIPRKSNPPLDAVEDRLFGFLKPQPKIQEGHFNGTYLELLNAFISCINGKIILEDNVIRVERRDWNKANPEYVMPKVELECYSNNLFELNSNVLIEFKRDLSDTNTFDNYEGNITQIQTSLANPKNKDLNLLKGDKYVNIPFARASRKETLTGVEKILQTLLKPINGLLNGLVAVVNEVINLVNKVMNGLKKFIKAINKIPGVNIPFDPKPIKPLNPSNLDDFFENRIGMMMLSNDYFEVPKITTWNINSTPKQTKLKTNNNDFFNSESVYNNYYKIDSFFTSTPNYWLRYSAVDVPFCLSDFKKVQKNNYIIDAKGDDAKIEKLSWNSDFNKADIYYRVQQNISLNLQGKITTPNGY